MPIPPRMTTIFRALPTDYASSNQRARDAAAEEVARIGREERHPEREQALLELEAARHEINGKPVGDEEPHRIRQRLANDDAPRLSAGAAAWRRARPAPGAPLSVVLRSARMYCAFSRRDARVLFRTGDRPIGTRSARRNPSAPVMMNTGRQLSNVA